VLEEVWKCKRLESFHGVVRLFAIDRRRGKRDFLSSWRSLPQHRYAGLDPTTWSHPRGASWRSNLRPSLVWPRWQVRMGHLAKRSRVQFWPRYLRIIQSCERFVENRTCSPACDVGIQLGPRQERGHSFQCAKLLLSMRKRSFNHGSRRTHEIQLVSVFTYLTICIIVCGSTLPQIKTKCQIHLYAPQTTSSDGSTSSPQKWFSLFIVTFSTHYLSKY
jgi:hypothetical protein